MEPPGDETLPESLAAGDDRAFASLYDRFAQRLYRAAVGMLGRREDAEDVVQEVFAAVFQARRQLAGSQDLTAYLFTALRRAAARCAERRARQPALNETVVDAAAAPEQDEASNPHGDRLQRALLALPAEQREAIALKIDGGLTFAEIAQVLGVSINTAVSRYRYALDKLRASLNVSINQAE
jgi:RNA polymerase sigma-70 factor, ECF subfamily